ncbi:MAG: hypothetical protein KFB93_03575 [Simkaniaceae bacterium]|nr:MAG: hypothetical protein KFB93_03575 [Simkaniaceae bacterium]
MVEAVDSSQCHEIAEEVLKGVTDHITEQNKNTLEKTLIVSMDVFSKGEKIRTLTAKETFIQLPAGERMKKKVGPSTIEVPGINLLKIMNKKRAGKIREWVQKLEMPFDKLDFSIALLADSNEVFAENKSFDQFRIISKEAV